MASAASLDGCCPTCSDAHPRQWILIRSSAMHAAIVAGGFGTRAAGMTADRIPKALLPVDGVPIIFRQMRVLRREGVTRVTVLAGHLGNQLQAVRARSRSTRIGLLIIEATPLGTAGCLSVLNPTTEDTLIVYGDMLFDVALAPLFDFHRHRALLTVVAHPNDHPRTSDLIVEDGGLVKAILLRDRRAKMITAIWCRPDCISRRPHSSRRSNGNKDRHDRGLATDASEVWC